MQEVKRKFSQFYALIGYFYYHKCSTSHTTKDLVKQNAFKDNRSMQCKKHYLREYLIKVRPSFHMRLLSEEQVEGIKKYVLK